MGDEVRRTQRGNNNPYCQDNAISWFDWGLVAKQQGELRFFSRMIALRKAHPTLHRARFFVSEMNARGVRDVAWHGNRLNEPPWNDPNARELSYTLGGIDDDPDFHVIFNMNEDAMAFDLPTISGFTWRRVLDTSLPSPDDFAEPGRETPMKSASYSANGHSVVVLVGAPA
jgi:isoamylase